METHTHLTHQFKVRLKCHIQNQNHTENLV